MTDLDPFTPPAGQPPWTMPAASAAPLPGALESSLERVARELLRERRRERRWRIFFRLAWLGLALFVVLAMFVQRGHGSTPG